MACSYGSRRKGTLGGGNVAINIVDGMPNPTRYLYESLRLPLTYEIDIDSLCSSEPSKPAEWSPLDYVNAAYFIWKARQWAIYLQWSASCECSPPPPPPPPDPQPPSGDGSDPLTEGSFPSPYAGSGSCKDFFDSFYDEWKQDFLSQLASFSAKAAEVALAGGTLDFVARYQRTNPDGSPSNKVVTDNGTRGNCSCTPEARDWYLYLYTSSVAIEQRDIVIEFPHSFNWIELCSPDPDGTNTPETPPPPAPPVDPCSCGGFAAILAAIAGALAAILAALATQTGVITAAITAGTGTVTAAVTAQKAALSAEIAAAKTAIIDEIKKISGGSKPPIALLVLISQVPKDSITFGNGNAPDLQKLGWYFWSIQKGGVTYYGERKFILTKRTVLVAPSSDERWAATFHFVDGVTAQLLPLTLE